MLSGVADRALSVLQAPFVVMGEMASVGASAGDSVKPARTRERWTVEAPENFWLIRPSTAPRAPARDRSVIAA